MIMPDKNIFKVNYDAYIHGLVFSFCHHWVYSIDGIRLRLIKPVSY